MRCVCSVSTPSASHRRLPKMNSSSNTSTRLKRTDSSNFLFSEVSFRYSAARSIFFTCVGCCWQMRYHSLSLTGSCRKLYRPSRTSCTVRYAPSAQSLSSQGRFGWRTDRWATFGWHAARRSVSAGRDLFALERRIYRGLRQRSYLMTGPLLSADRTSSRTGSFRGKGMV